MLEATDYFGLHFARRRSAQACLRWPQLERAVAAHARPPAGDSARTLLSIDLVQPGRSALPSHAHLLGICLRSHRPPRPVARGMDGTVPCHALRPLWNARHRPGSERIGGTIPLVPAMEILDHRPSARLTFTISSLPATSPPVPITTRARMRDWIGARHVPGFPYISRWFRSHV